MYKSATLPGAENLMRPDNDDYMSKGYVPLREQYDNSVSHALEYYIADFALSRFADALGKKKDAEMFYKRSLGYKHYYSKEFGTFRPILPDGTFYSPVNPRQGENFEPNPGNDDTGTMSAWAIFNMIGFYPDCPGLPEYTLTTPVFNKVTIRLDPKWYKENELVIESNRTGSETLYINKVLLDGKKFNKYRITHDELVHGKRLIFDLK